MKTKYHINPATGKPGRCNPEKTGVCRYGEAAVHYSSEEKAMAAYELSMESEMFSNTIESSEQPPLPGMEEESLAADHRISSLSDLDGFEKGTLLEKNGRIFEIGYRPKDLTGDFNLSEITPNGHLANSEMILSVWDESVQNSRVVDNKTALQILAKQNPDSLAAKALESNEPILSAREIAKTSTTDKILDINEAQPFDLYIEPKSGALYQVSYIHLDKNGKRAGVSVERKAIGEFDRMPFYLSEESREENRMSRLDTYRKMDDDFTRRFIEEYNAQEGVDRIPSRSELEEKVKALESERENAFRVLESTLSDKSKTLEEKNSAIAKARATHNQLHDTRALLHPDDKEFLFKSRLESAKIAKRHYQLSLDSMSLLERRRSGKIYRANIELQNKSIAEAEQQLSQLGGKIDQ